MCSVKTEYLMVLCTGQNNYNGKKLKYQTKPGGRHGKVPWAITLGVRMLTLVGMGDAILHLDNITNPLNIATVVTD